LHGILTGRQFLPIAGQFPMSEGMTLTASPVLSTQLELLDLEDVAVPQPETEDA